jgi:hypothetical protein
MAINRIRRWYDEHRESCRLGEDDLCRKILANVIGFDLNPLAVMAARTNYLIAMRDLIGHVDSVEIPVYLCDSILTPSEYGGLLAGTALGKAKELKTAATNFLVPTEIAGQREDIAKYAEQLEFCVRNGYSPKEFVDRCREEGLPITAESLHADLYSELVKLDKANKNGVWARIIKNAFAPLFVGRVDYIAGNPPWVNWESLPNDYRQAIKPQWERYGLFTLKGHAARLGGGKKDLSMLFVYRCIDSYLDQLGTLGFVITQTLFKTREAGDGFRRLSFAQNGRTIHLVPQKVIDMTDLHPFEGATNRTATFVCRQSDRPTDWPVPYETWTLRSGTCVNDNSQIDSVRENVVVRKMGAVPMHSDRVNSAWLTVAKDAIPGLTKAMGSSKIKAHAGVCTWMNGVFWLRSVTPLKSGKVQIVNWNDVGKIVVDRVETVIEDDLVYPLLRGRDVHRWQSSPSTHILLTQDPATRTGLAENVMKRKFRLTYEYLRPFEERLRKRPGYIKYFDPQKDPFWTIYNVGEYSVSPFRVVFKELTDFFQCAVVDPTTKPAIADTKLRFIACQSRDEAYFLCGLLNSSPATLYLYATATWVQTADYQASDISRLRLPGFNHKEPLHTEIAKTAKECHLARASGDGEALATRELSLDEFVVQMWGISKKEMDAIRRCLKEYGFSSQPCDKDED